MQRNYFFVLILILGLLGPGCAASKHTANYQRAEVDLALVGQIAVLPFANYTSDKYSARRVRELFGTQILAMGLFDMVDNTIVDSKLAEEAIEADDPIDPAILKRLGQRLNVEAFLLGSVDQYEKTRKGTYQFPEVALTLRLVAANSGTILYQASGYRSGETLSARLLGIEPRDQYHVTVALIDDLLAGMQ